MPFRGDLLSEGFWRSRESAAAKEPTLSDNSFLARLARLISFQVLEPYSDFSETKVSSFSRAVFECQLEQHRRFLFTASHIKKSQREHSYYTG